MKLSHQKQWLAFVVSTDAILFPCTLKNPQEWEIITVVFIIWSMNGTRFKFSTISNASICKDWRLVRITIPLAIFWLLQPSSLQSNNWKNGAKWFFQAIHISCDIMESGKWGLFSFELGWALYLFLSAQLQSIPRWNQLKHYQLAWYLHCQMDHRPAA